MARLQILELPEGANDDRPPFVLVVDQYVARRYIQGIGQTAEPIDEFSGIAEKIGARAVLVFEDTIDIPANDTSAYIQQAAEETGATVGEAVRSITAQQLAHERSDIARDADRLANHKAAITDALGIDRLQSWDDIRNAAREIRQEADVHAEAVARIRNLHRPVDYFGVTICWECSAYDFERKTTDNPTVAHDQCGTLRVLNGGQEQS